MSGLYLSRGLYPVEFLKPTVAFILEAQRPWGEIPWFEGGHSDPWDHTEAAMGLSIAGEYAAAESAYRWLADSQLADGSWWRSYRDGKPDNPDRRESNYVAYVATGVWHHYLITGDTAFLKEFFPVVDAAMAFVLALQGDAGEIDWSVDATGEPMGDALVTGCSS
ncbi:MAG: prenyltransferase, partial [Luminiphilus sp.]